MGCLIIFIDPSRPQIGGPIERFCWIYTPGEGSYSTLIYYLPDRGPFSLFE